MTDSVDTKAITSAGIRFPRTGLHTYHLNDKVTFTDKFARVHTGPITGFERYEKHMYVTVATGDGHMLVELRTVLPAEHPDAVAMAEAGTPDHLVCGTVVRVTGLPSGKEYGGIRNGDLGVVLQDKGLRVNVAKLGGHQDGYGRFLHERLTVVKVDPRTGAQE